MCPTLVRLQALKVTRLLTLIGPAGLEGCDIYGADGGSITAALDIAVLEGGASSSAAVHGDVIHSNR